MADTTAAAGAGTDAATVVLQTEKGETSPPPQEAEGGKEVEKAEKDQVNVAVSGREPAAMTIEELFDDEPEGIAETASASAPMDGDAVGSAAEAEEEEEGEEEVDAEGLFGSDSEGDERVGAAAADEEEEPAEIDEVTAPVISGKLGDEIYIAKLPNFFSIEPRPFDPATFREEFGEE